MPPTTTRLLLISHASTAALRAARFPLDEALDDPGRAAATALAPLVAAALGSGAAHALSGPDRRSQETAAAVGLVASVEFALRDLDIGRWAGHTIDELLAAEPDGFVEWMRDPDAVPHGGESVVALIARVSTWLTSVSTPGGARTVAVSHPAVLRAAVLAVLGGAATSFWSVDVEPLATVRLHCTAGRWRVRFGPDSDRG